MMRLGMMAAIVCGTVMMAGPAQADPIAIGIIGINALLGTSLTSATVVATVGALSITFGQVVGTALAVGGSVLAGALSRQGGKKGQPINPANARSTFVTSQSGEIRSVGRARVGQLEIYR